MKKLFDEKMLVTVICLSLQVFSLNIDDGRSTALSILNNLGRKAGITVLPVETEDGLAKGFLSQSSMTVWVTAPDRTQFKNLRTNLDGTGALGRRIYLDIGSTQKLAFPDNYVDLIVITNLNDNTIKEIKFDEIRRVLNPGGKAWIGRTVSEGNFLTDAGIQNVISSIPNALKISDNSGKWIVITKESQIGVDQWTHALHGPDNNPSSNDTLLKFPFLPHWRAKPYFNVERQGVTVTGGGRAYVAINDAASWGKDCYLKLRTYRIYNGQVLWKLNIRKQVNAPEVNVKSIMAASDQYLYVIVNDTLREYNGETGTLNRNIFIDNSTARLKWMCLSDGLAYVGIGDTMVDSVSDNGWNKFYFIKSIKAIALNNLTVAWTHTENTLIDVRDIGIIDKKMFVSVRNSRIFCLNSLTGTQIWVNTKPEVVNPISALRTVASWPVGGASGFLCSPQGLFVCNPEKKYLLSLSPTTGDILWQTEASGGRMQAKVLGGNGILFNRDVADQTKKSWNVFTKAEEPLYKNIPLGAGCGIISYSKDGIFGNSGGQSYNFPKQTGLKELPYKTDCGTGAIISDGLMLMTNSTSCTCFPNRGMNADGSAGTFSIYQQAVETECLEKGEVWNQYVDPLKEDSLDWPVYRGNSKKSSSTKATIPYSQLKLLSTYTPAFPYDSVLTPLPSAPDTFDQLSTQPVVVGNFIYWGGTDGYLRCYDISQSRLLWSQYTSGRIIASPTVSDGYVYVGSMDGYVYCYEAIKGRLAWRFRGAPVERRISFYGQLASTWPILTGVEIYNGKAYFAAGHLSQHGVYVYELNAKTGALIWQNNSSGSYLDTLNRRGISVSGGLLIVGNKLWVKSQTGRCGIFNLENGLLDSLPAGLKGRDGGPSKRGHEIGLIDDNHVVLGGRYPFMDFNERASIRGHVGYDFLRLDNNKAPLYAQVGLILNSNVLAWNETNIIIPSKGSENYVEKWNKVNAMRLVDSLQQANSNPANYQWWQEFSVRQRYNENDTNPTPLMQWRKKMELNGVALSKDLLVTLNASMENKWADQSTWKWYLTVFRTETMDTLYKSLLPSIPLHNGLAISRRGDIIVAMKSGSILIYGKEIPTTGVAESKDEDAFMKPASKGKLEKALQRAIEEGIR